MTTMQTKKNDLVLKIIVAASFAAMVFVNYLAQMLPLNGQTPGQISDSLLNLFAPAGLTFSIWGVIYILLAAFSIFQFGFYKGTPAARTIDNIRIVFIISSLANIAWIFSWHYLRFGLSMVFMAVLLISLIIINLRMDKKSLNLLEKAVFRLPFSLYFGWITVATVANVTSWLVSFKWNGFGLAEQGWTVIILIVAALIGALTMYRRRDIAYGLVLIWAYIGIYIKHQSSKPLPLGFDGNYPLIMGTVIACLVLFAVTEGYLIWRAIKHKRNESSAKV